MNEFDKIVNEVKSKNRFLVVSHENPDCDAIGSSIALGLALEGINKKVTIYNESGVPKFLKFLPESDRIKNDVEEINLNDFDVVVILDCADLDRTGSDFVNLIESAEDVIKIMIDHHKTNHKKGDLVLIDVNASSTGVLIYKILKALDVEIDWRIAESIFSTIVGDTGSFNYSNTTSEALRIASELVEYGANPEKISHELYENESLNKLRLTSLVLPTLKLDESGEIAFLYVDKKMYKLTETNKEDTEGLVNFARSVEGIQVATLFKEDSAVNGSQVWKVSIRSKGEVDVSSVAEKFGGGGHQKAAGFSVKGNLDQVIEKVNNAVKEEMEKR